MSRAIEHRGPDSIGHWTGGPVGLSNLLLQTVAQSTQEKQPLVGADGLRCLTMDGRIDNREELKHDLESKGFRIRHKTDAELVLCAYEQWGEECPIRLLGDFAFAIWDGRKKQLFCARDYVGVRPFYYHHSPTWFAFGSEIRAILALEAVPRRLNESRLADFLVEILDREDEESTFYQDVLRLPAGHCLVVAPGQFTIRDYWNLRAPAILRLGSLEEYSAAFREVFVEAVRCRLLSSHRVGSTLSGGIDSSSVVCTTRKLLSGELREPLHTVSLVDADESKCGETPYIQDVLREGWLVPHIVRSSDVSNLEPEMREADEPFEFSHYFPNHYIFSAARDAGVRVLLDGISGDHITAPSNYLSILIRNLRWKSAITELSYRKEAYQEGVWSNLALYGIGPLLPNPSIRLREHIRKYRKSLLQDSLINGAFADRMGVSERLEARSRKAWDVSQDLGTLHCWSFTSGILPFFFEQSGRIAASMRIEARHPFSDRRIIEFFLSLPLKMKTFGPLPKRVIRVGMKGILPENVRCRTRFAHPGGSFATSLVARSASILEPATFGNILASVGEYVNVNWVEAMRLSALRGEANSSSSLWQILSLAVWFKNKKMCAIERTLEAASGRTKV
jgi:asparagine synthase (glutamine-hydrolysing)